MKINFFKLYTFLFSVFILLGVYSCQDEPLYSEQNLLEDNSFSKIRNAKVEFVFDCETPPANNVILYAGQTIPVGTVNVEEDGFGNYNITYDITNVDYCLTQTHLSVVEFENDFPMTKKGNPIPGQFEFSESHDCVTNYTYNVPILERTYIAAHAVVQCKPIAITVEEFDATLPGTIDFCITTGREIVDAKSYLYLEIADGDLVGNYWAWCADESKEINSTDGPICYEQFNVYSLFDDLTGIISETDNIDNALWLINNSDEILNSENYQYGHIQWALWKLLNNQECNSCAANLKLTGDYLGDAMAIYSRAINEGEGYMAECEDYTMVIFDNGTLQPVIIPVLIPCDEPGCEETAMGAGCDFPGNNWFTYFEYGTNASKTEPAK